MVPLFGFPMHSHEPHDRRGDNSASSASATSPGHVPGLRPDTFSVMRLQSDMLRRALSKVPAYAENHESHGNITHLVRSAHS